MKNKWNNPFGGLFDFNRNGKTEPWELWILHQMIKDSMKVESDIELDDTFPEDEILDTSISEQYGDATLSLPEQYAWRQDCPDGSEYDIYPDDYETEDEYLEALEDAENAWRDKYDESEIGLSPYEYETEDDFLSAVEDARNEYISQLGKLKNLLDYLATLPVADQDEKDTSDAPKEEDFPNRRTYVSARELATAIEEENFAMIERCKFVLNNPDIIAAKYCTVVYGMFLYGQAVKDNFQLPVTLPDEDEHVKTDFFDVIRLIAEKDIPLSLKVWNWCVDCFVPYDRYIDHFGVETLTCTVIRRLLEMPDGFADGLEQYLSDNPEFSEKIIRHAPKLDKHISEVLYQAVLKNDFEAAVAIFKDALNNPSADAETITGMVDIVFGSCRTGTETEILERTKRVKDWFLPILKQQDNQEYWAYVDKTREEISSFCNVIEYRLQRERDKERNWIELKNLMKSMEDIIQRMEQKNEWFSFDSNTPKSITYDFIYPNGKNGDIDMFIATNYGQLRKLDELHYSVELSTAYKDEILLLEYIYTHSLHDNMPRNELSQFLHDYNLGHRLRQYCDTYIVLGGHTLSVDRTDEEILKSIRVYNAGESDERILRRLEYAKIRSHAMTVANSYMDSIRRKRNSIYGKVVKQGITSARWISEQKAYLIVKNIYPDAIFQYRSDWLGLQSLDIYIPSKKIAIEYQGKQHYESVELFGGKEKFAENQIRDKTKRKKCSEHGVRLIEWRYDAPLTEEYIADKISETCNKTMSDK